MFVYGAAIMMMIRMFCMSLFQCLNKQFRSMKNSDPKELMTGNNLLGQT